MIAGRGFVTSIEKVDEEVKSFDEALSKMKAMPKGDKNVFYTYDQKAGTIGKYSAEDGHAGMKL